MPIKQLDHFLHYRLDQLNQFFRLQVEWDYWRNDVSNDGWTSYAQFHGAFRESPTMECPTDLNTFLAKFQTGMEAKGWTPALLEGLPLYQAYLAQRKATNPKDDRPARVGNEQPKGIFHWLKKIFD
jgi:hypothetical protein